MPDARVPVRIYEDYICPFCYIGHTRLMRLAREEPLDIEVQLMEIHPETPPEGRPLAALGYPAEQRRIMEDNLRRMAVEDDLPLAARERTVNSRRALQLGEAIRRQHPDLFLPYSERIFQSYFAAGGDISDPALLRRLATEFGLDAGWVADIGQDDMLAAALREHAREAARIGLRGVPGFVIGRYLLRGAVPFEDLYRAVQLARQEKEETHEPQ